MTDEPFVTYRLADGSLIYGEYTFMCEDDTWTNGDLDEPVDVVKETWVCVERECITFKPDWWDESREEDDTVDLVTGCDGADDVPDAARSDGVGHLQGLA